jgi:hypothetical protein
VLTAPGCATSALHEYVAKLVQLSYRQSVRIGMMAPTEVFPIKTMRYDEVAQVLTVVFRGWGGTTRYFDVSPADWAELDAVFSKSAYLARMRERRRSVRMPLAA